MTDLEFDILDQLYFPITAKQIADELQLPLEAVENTLKIFAEQKLIKRMDEEDLDTFDLIKHADLMLVASKLGLLTHNGRA